MGVIYDPVLNKYRAQDPWSWAVEYSVVPKLFSGVWDPNGVVTATKVGDEYIDTSTWHKWYAQSANDSGRKEMNYME